MGRRRFIPAGAGNATQAVRRWAIRSVHPRGCGERSHRLACNIHQVGSSPRVRGTPGQAAPQELLHRFIPAGAGNAPARWGWSSCRTVHPRGCGERHLRRLVEHHHVGSSPRVRGTRLDRLGRGVGVRFIPAGAGNAHRSVRPTRVSAVHPRGCGERNSRCWNLYAVAGSSPRVRGTL